MVCDFCADPAPDDPEHTVFTREPIIYYDVFNVKHVDTVDWATCDECLTLIRAKDRDGLLTRCIHKMNAGYYSLELAAYQKKFWDLLIDETELEKGEQQL